MSTVIGRDVVRSDALEKVSGLARYPADLPHEDMAYAVLVTSTVARGRIRRIDTSAAEAIAGIRLVLTHLSLDQDLGEGGFFLGAKGRFQSSFNPMGSDQIAYHGQIVAMVVADSQEIGEEAAGLLAIEYDVTEAQADIASAMAGAAAIAPLSVDIGDAPAVLAQAPVSISSEYHTAAMHQNPIELYATTALWIDERLQVELPSQWIIGTHAALANAFGLPREQVTVTSTFVGGAFGAKASVLWHTVLTAMAARRVGRPVKLVVSRPQGFTVGSFRPETRHLVKLAASRDGRLLAYDHEGWGQVSRADADAAALPGTIYSTHIYATPNIRAREYAVATDVNTPGYMRGPLEYPYNFAQESAIDELAIALDMDPIELRALNEPDLDPVTKRPYSSRSLIPCFRRGAELFGWSRRNRVIGSMRADDGRLLGLGCAAAYYPTYRAASEANVRIDVEGRAEVSVSAHDLGTGAYTILRQIAAEDLGIPMDRVKVSLGSSELPIGPMAAGSSTTASAGSAVRLASRNARQKLLTAAARSALFAGRDPSTLDIRNGRVIAADGESVALASLVGEMPESTLYTTARWSPPELDTEKVRTAMDGRLVQAEPFSDTHTMFSFGAQFAEVKIDPLTRRIELGRLVGVFACGRIINPRTTRSQLMGGMIWGASHALMEEGVFDKKRAHFANTDLGSYHFAVNADIHDVIVETIHEHDVHVNPLGVKGVGETGVIGMAPAIANAVHHATGIRVRKTPILIDDLLDGVN